jgi:hypothetical protein
MTIESVTHADLAGRLGTSREAAHSLVRRLRLPRQTANDGTVRVNVDLAETQYSVAPKHSPRGHRADFDALKAEIEQLQTEVTRLGTEKGAIEAIAAGHRADFERERERSGKLTANTMSLAAAAMSARLKATRLESELAARQSPFWMRLRTRRSAAASEQFQANALLRTEEPIMQLQSIPAAGGRVRRFAELAVLVTFAALITAFVEYGIPFFVR